MMAAFAALLVVFLVGSLFAAFRWSHPLSLIRKIVAVEFALGTLVSGTCLLTAKSASPQANQRRFLGLWGGIFILQIIVDVLR
jgi:ABC-type sulfate transport system permease component